MTSEMCWFCKKNGAGSTPFILTMSIVSARSIIGLPARYKVVDVPVPRCSSCDHINTRRLVIMWTPTVIGVVTLLFTCLLAHSMDGASGLPGVVLVIGGLIWAAIVNTWWLNFRVADYPPIAALLKEGWDFGVPANTRPI